MENEKYSSNTSINEAIIESLVNFDPISQGKMKKAIIDAKRAAEKIKDENTDSGARHIFREFIPASEFNKCGFCFEYEKLINGKTPDWIDERNKILMECFTYERGGSSEFIQRIESRIQEKADKYKEIIIERSYSMMISIYIDFLSDMMMDELIEYKNEITKIIKKYKLISTILFFSETYVQNKKQCYGYMCYSEMKMKDVYPNWPFSTVICD
jgi:hypothetical protein